MRILKYFGAALVVGALLITATLALAQEQSGNLPGDFGNKIQRVKKVVSTPQSQVQNPGLRSLKNSQKEPIDFEKKSQQLMSSAQDRAKNAQTRVQELRQQAEARGKQQQDKLQQKLAGILDKQKQQLAGRIADQFARINKVWTDHFTQLLDRYDAILQKIQVRDDKAAANGKDITAVSAAIQSAKTAITAARSAVEVQAAKTYVADTSTIKGGTVTASTTPSGQGQLMQGLQSAFKALRDQLFHDLFALRDGAMKDARSAVQNALQSLSRVPGVDEEPTATSTPAANQ